MLLEMLFKGEETRTCTIKKGLWNHHINFDWLIMELLIDDYVMLVEICLSKRYVICLYQGTVHFHFYS